MSDVESRPSETGHKTLRVGFIGLGSQGGPMARRIRESGYPLTLWARRPESLEPFSDLDVSLADTPAEVGSGSDIVGLCVVADADVQEVVLGDDGVLSGMARGSTLAVHSTVHPETCLDLAQKAAEVGVAVIDAPVSGGGVAAAERRLLVMVGGEEADVDRCRPVFETFGNPVTHLGPLGSGELAKLLNNLVFTALVGAALDTISSAELLGIAPSALADVLSNGSGGSKALAMMAATNFDLSGLRGAKTLLQKDVNLVLDVMRARGVPEPSRLLELAQHTLQALEDPT